MSLLNPIGELLVDLEEHISISKAEYNELMLMKHILMLHDCDYLQTQSEEEHTVAKSHFGVYLSGQRLYYDGLERAKKRSKMWFTEWDVPETVKHDAAKGEGFSSAPLSK